MTPEQPQDIPADQEDDATTAAAPGVAAPADQPEQTTPSQQDDSDNGELELEDEADQQPEPFEPISWEASEYIHHERDALWVIGFIVLTVGLLALAIFLLKSYTFAGLIVVMAAALGIYVKRAPRVLRYSLSSQGLHVGQKFYSFSEFRAYGILHDGALYSVLLLPTARFAPSTHIYFAEENGEKIVDILASYLPVEEVQFDMVDNLLRRLRL